MHKFVTKNACKLLIMLVIIFILLVQLKFIQNSCLLSFKNRIIKINVAYSFIFCLTVNYVNILFRSIRKKLDVEI